MKLLLFASYVENCTGGKNASDAPKDGSTKSTTTINRQRVEQGEQERSPSRFIVPMLFARMVRIGFGK